jgi:NAD(P)-dependent dehydrogenase (short-subunit alcohol dehydrogenase family)
MKGGVEVFTRYLAKELGSRGITANTVAPGLTETDFTKPFLPTHEEGVKQVASIFALGRVGRPDDIGGVVAFFVHGGSPVDHGSADRGFGWAIVVGRCLT